jgi:hypothetical protein
VRLYMHSSIRLQGVVLKYLSTGTLPFAFYLYSVADINRQVAVLSGSLLYKFEKRGRTSKLARGNIISLLKSLLLVI